MQDNYNDNDEKSFDVNPPENNEEIMVENGYTDEPPAAPESDKEAAEMQEVETDCSVSPTKMCVMKLVFWRDPVQSGLICGGILFACFCLSCFSLISVLSYTGLTILIVSVLGRGYTQFVGSPDMLPAPVRKMLLAEKELGLSDDQVNDFAERLKKRIKVTSQYLLDLLTVKDYGQSIKFAAILYIMTYIGEMFNFLTLCILATGFAFALPPIYEMNKANIDNAYEILKKETCVHMKKATDAMKNLPIFGKKEKSN